MSKKKIPDIIKQIQNHKSIPINYAYQKGVSFSQLQMYLQCKYHWYLQYNKKHKVFTSSINTVFGSAIHSTVQLYIKTLYEKSGVAADALNLEEYFEEQFKTIYSEKYKENKNIHFSSSEEMDEFYHDALEILDFVKKKRNEYFGKKGWWLVGIETPIIMAPNSTHKNVLFNGFIDLILYHEPTEQFVIFDIKTSRQSWSEKQKKDEVKQFQILLYKYFFSEQFGVPIENIDVKFFILKRKIWENSEFPQKRIQEFTPTNGKTKINRAKNALNQFVEDVFDIDGTFKEKEYAPNASKENCRYCPFLNHKENLCTHGIS